MENSEAKESSAIKRAVDSLGHGGQTILAKHLGVKPQAVQKMCASGHVPKRRVDSVASFFGLPADHFKAADVS